MDAAGGSVVAGFTHIFEVRARRRRRITLDPDLYKQLEYQAHARGVLPETLANLWLGERLQKVG